MTDRRPQRHRRGVNHYSDDNPSTFTIKRKRGEPPPPPPTDSAAKRRAARAEGRRQRELQQLPQLPPHHPNHQKRGPGRPPSTNNHKHSSAPSSRKRARPSKTSSSSSSSLATQLKTPPVIPPPKDEILSHTVSIQPVLPLNVPERRSFQQRYPLLYQDGRTLPPTAATTSDGGWIRIPEAHKERWVPLLSSNPPQPSSSSSHNSNCNNNHGKGDSRHETNNNNNQQQEEESSLIALPPAPWTCFAVRQDDPLYVCVGDAAGNLLLYHRCPQSVCIQTVRTLASKREAQRKIAWSQSKTPLTAANAHNGIGACTWRGHVCVVWTKQEVEILDVVQHSTLAVLPLDHLVAAPQTSLVPNGSNHNNNNHTTNPVPCNSNNSHNSKRRQPQSFSYQSLDLHSTQSFLLWRPNGCRVAKETTTEDTGASLLCVDFSEAGAKRKVLVPQPTQTRDVFCHAAVWDVHSQTNEMLTVQSHPQSSEGGENGSSNSSNTNAIASLCRVCVDTGEITQRTTLPESGSVSGRLSTIYTDCVLEQYEDYLFLCTGRGIRCYERNRLTFLTVYGETVALHGTTVGWQACFWIPEPSFDPSELAVSAMASSSSASSASFKHNKQSCWIQRPDEMQKRDWAEQHQEQHRQLHLQQQQKHHHHHKEESLSRQESLSSTQSNHNAHHHPPEGLSNSFGSHSSNGSTATKQTANKLFSNMLLVGVPHPTRGPEELQSTLYVWKPGQVLPLTTLQAPRGGLLGLHIHATPTTGWRLTCATAKFGQGWQLSATLKSDFAGTMYPVGYQLLTDNVEYLEDEGELDQVLVLPPQQQQTNDETPLEDSDLQKALKRSLETAGEDRISVLLDVAELELEENRVLVPSVPDPSLCEVFEEGDDSGGGRSPGRRFRSAPQTLSLFPSFKDAKGLAQEQQPQDERQTKGPAAPLPTVSTEPPVETAAKGKGKRSRATNIEAMLQSSIDGALKHKMDGLHKAWNSGGGSRFKQTTESDDPPRNHEVAVPFLLPASAAEAEKQASKLPPKPAPVSVPTDVSVEVTPSEPSPATTVDGNKDPFCAACCDRMVVHTCGKRELPVDTEALERAERARKEAEEAEAKRVRAEKRRIAEAKRRETRRKKKEEEDRRRYMERLEEERRLREEEEQKAQMALMHPEKQRVTLDLVDYSQQPELPAAAARPAIPKFSELRTNGYATSSSGTSTSAPHGFFSSANSNTTATEGYSLSVAAAAAPTSSLYPEAATTTSSAWASSTAEADSGFYNATDPSSDMASPPVATTLTGADGDALAALVGLADSMAPKSNTPPPTTQEVRHYDYSGSSDRRTAILKQLSHFKQFNNNNSEPSPGETPPFHSPNARQMNGGNNSAVSSPTTTYNGEAPSAGGWVAGTGDPNNPTG